MSATDLHEAEASLSKATIDEHRAYRSLMEELEAIDWYAQRIDASTDPQLKEILRHNRDEEKEHAAMVLEWLRRRDQVFDRYLREYLLKDGPIKELDEHVGAAASDGSVAIGLGIGSLRKPRTLKVKP